MIIPKLKYIEIIVFSFVESNPTLAVLLEACNELAGPTSSSSLRLSNTAPLEEVAAVARRRRNCYIASD